MFQIEMNDYRCMLADKNVLERNYMSAICAQFFHMNCSLFHVYHTVGPVTSGLLKWNFLQTRWRYCWHL